MLLKDMALFAAQCLLLGMALDSTCSPCSIVNLNDLARHLDIRALTLHILLLLLEDYVKEEKVD